MIFNYFIKIKFYEISLFTEFTQENILFVNENITFNNLINLILEDKDVKDIMNFLNLQIHSINNLKINDEEYNSRGIKNKIINIFKEENNEIIKISFKIIIGK